MDLLIFDLDGTLVDSKLDLAQAVNATRGHMGLTPLPNDTVYTYVGNGAPVLLRRAMGPEMPQSEVDRALAYFLAYYAAHKLDYTVLYPGVREALDQYKNAGRRMAVLTNKPFKISQAILDGLDVGTYFFRVYGGNSFEQKKPDPIGIQRLMEEAGIPAARTLMIGDSAVDIRTARNAGVPCAGVTWGFQPDSLTADPPDVLIDDIADLTKYILSTRP